MVKSLKRGALVELAVEQLLDQLAAGRWPVGTSLPGEVSLAEQLGVGRSTVREATRALVHAGLLEARQGSGTYVLALTPPPSLDSALRKAKTVEVYEVREALEVQAAVLACARRTEDDLERLRAALTRRDRLIDGQQDHSGEFVEADLAFHRAIVDAAHNELLGQTFATFETVLAETLRNVVDDAILEGHDVDTAHRELLEAIEAQDEAAAAAAVRTNVRRTIEAASEN
ncbi:FadR/GntR family transcriptional regulator [Streptomyces sp. NPDC051018]|uniref:FadR/GntR family transcriptional regulator n=1 Tax=Streptomyces sp. NPDC051018 TaxID=3365639 RepID=UPI0037BA1CEA